MARRAGAGWVAARGDRRSRPRPGRQRGSRKAADRARLTRTLDARGAISQTYATDTKRAQQILVVEDNEHTRRLLDTILHTSGYEVTLAPDAEEGLRVLQDASIDLVILDLFLPGANGIQFLRSRAELPEDRQPPVIVVSAAEDMDALRPQLRELGAKLALRKPFDVEELLDGVRTFATKRTTAPATAPSAQAAKAGRTKAKGKSASKP